MTARVKKGTAPTVSIIIANYNYAKYIGDALESVLAQTFHDWECIVIDDGSTDDSVKIIKQYVARDARFRLIKNPHLGVSAARNAGLDAARGEFIGFLDSDDCFTDYALEMLVHFARTTGADMVGGTASIIPPNFHFLPSKNRVWSADMIGGQNNPARFLLVPMAYKWCWLWRRIYKRELIGDTRFLPEFTTFGDDLTFMLDICWRATSIVETPNISVYHRVQPQGITQSRFDTFCFDWFPTYFRYIAENLLDKYDGRFWRAFYQNSFRYLMSETLYRPKQYGKLQNEAKNALIASCRYIPRRYLTAKQRILCWFLTCLK